MRATSRRHRVSVAAMSQESVARMAGSYGSAMSQESVARMAGSCGRR